MILDETSEAPVDKQGKTGIDDPSAAVPEVQGGAPSENGPKVQLKNGQTIDELIFVPASLNLDLLLKEGIPGMLAFADLGMLVRQNKPITDERSLALLRELGLIDENGMVPPALSPIIDASIEGEGQDIHFVNPLARN